MRSRLRSTDERASADERGSVTPLIIGFAVVVALLVGVVVDASAAFLRRQGLDSAADAAALAATDGLQGEQVYTHGLGNHADIDPVAARRYVAQYVESSGIRRRFPGLDYAVTTTANTVVVRMVAPTDLPFRVPGAGTDVPVTGTAASVIEVSD
jgi:Flp pilus assembly protein TadG